MWPDDDKAQWDKVRQAAARYAAAKGHRDAAGSIQIAASSLGYAREDGTIKTRGSEFTSLERQQLILWLEASTILDFQDIEEAF